MPISLVLYIEILSNSYFNFLIEVVTSFKASWVDQSTGFSPVPPAR